MSFSITKRIDQYSQLDYSTIKRQLTDLLTKNATALHTKKTYENILGLIDLTSLNTEDSEESISRLTEKVNDFGDRYAEFNNVAAICVYPGFIKTVKELLTEDVEIVAVTGGFPHAQTFIEVKIAETSLAILDGATEIDTVLNIGRLKEKKYDEIIDEISEIKATCRDRHLKVILESGLLSTEELRIASILAMEAGADFIKTSTGKQQPAATLEAAWIMCTMISDYYRLTNRKVGFKAAGGIVATEDALKYYTIVDGILGKEWLNKSLFRFGASRLANNILSNLVEKPVIIF